MTRKRDDIDTNALIKAAEQVQARHERVTIGSLAAQLQCSSSTLHDRIDEARKDPRWKEEWAVPRAT